MVDRKRNSSQIICEHILNCVAYPYYCNGCKKNAIPIDYIDTDIANEIAQIACSTVRQIKIASSCYEENEEDICFRVIATILKSWGSTYEQ